MHTEFRRALVPRELRSLTLFDHKAFHRFPADWFHHEQWLQFETWWLLVDGRKVGCCAFERHVDFDEDLTRAEGNTPRRGSLYIASTAILPVFRGQGLGALLKCWQITFARANGFDRIVTNTRASNTTMLRLNKKFGFRKIRTTPDYYIAPDEPTIVMELIL